MADDSNGPGETAAPPETSELRGESTPNVATSPYLAPPVLDWSAIEAQLAAPPSITATHTLEGGFWVPNDGPPPEPAGATLLAKEATVDEANTLAFALMVYDALQRTTRDVPDAARNQLLGERRALRRVLAFLGFDSEARPTLEARKVVPPEFRRL